MTESEQSFRQLSRASYEHRTLEELRVLQKAYQSAFENLPTDRIAANLHVLGELIREKEATR